MKLPLCSAPSTHLMQIPPMLHRNRPSQSLGNAHLHRLAPNATGRTEPTGPATLQTPALAPAHPEPTVRDPLVVPDLSTLRIDTPMLAQRQVLKLRLANDLDVLLISDPGIARSGASLTVRAGSYDNPPQGEGMAHFIEHMLFMGTRKYPGENAYTRYLADYAGDHNAYTAADHTQYMLACNNAGFAGAIERLASFFTEPLFAAGALLRERQAVNAEFLRYHDSEAFRQNMVAAQLANPEHPASRFTIGSLASLANIDSAQLHAWHEQHYSANLMHLVLYSEQPLSSLRALAEAHFSHVPNRNLKPRVTTADPMSPRACGHLTYVASRKKSEALLSMSWSVPEALAADMSHIPLPLVGYVLGHGHAHGLQAHLKALGWANSVQPQVQRLLGGSGELNLAIELTEEGARHHEEILSLCFAAIGQVQKLGLPEYIFDEVAQTALRQYRFQSRDEPFATVTRHGRGLLYEALATYPDVITAPTAYSPEAIAAVAKALTPQTCAMMLSAHPDLVPWTTDKTEPYMGVAYRTMPVDEAQLQGWQKATAPEANFAIVPRNPFIPGNLTTAPLADDAPTAAAPKVIQDDDFGKIYFARDVYEKNPEIWWTFNIKSSRLTTPSAQDKVLSELYAAAVWDALSPTIDAASVAGLEGTVAPGSNGFAVQVSGFADKAPLFLKMLLEQLCNTEVSPSKFEEIKSTQLLAYADARRHSAITVARDTLGAVRDVAYLSPQACYEALKKVTLEDVQGFMRRALAKTYVVATLLGSMGKDVESNVLGLLKTYLAGAPCPELRGFDHRVQPLPPQALSVSDVAECDASTVLISLDHGPFDIQSGAAQQILEAAVSERFFDALRTKQKAGYAVAAYAENHKERLYSNFLVENNRHSVGDVRARIEQFIESFVDGLQDGSIDAAEYARLQQATRLVLEEPNRALSNEGRRLHSAIMRHGDIARAQKVAAAIGALPYEAFAAWVQANLGPANRRRLAILISGTVAPAGAITYCDTSIAQARQQAASDTPASN